MRRFRLFEPKFLLPLCLLAVLAFVFIPFSHDPFSNLDETSRLKLNDLTAQVDEGDAKSIFGSEKVIFFLESSGRATLKARQVCTIESVARNTPPDVTLAIVFVHPVQHLDMQLNVALFKLLKAHGDKVQIFTINAAQCSRRSRTNS
ncbi:uncharacterized protein LOC132197806 isoform X2 [Neocloeon triangulifer]|uniref:uncharacterized protein LOC132197806 isoform X2 n=1 Tax=Neocloeon triangulifer TaxID=2078957 RepID=UPI00286F5579|nr:uncharacterized protein LOC132197806 isoform X2 [Neocloeon triangulifer]